MLKRDVLAALLVVAGLSGAQAMSERRVEFMGAGGVKIVGTLTPPVGEREGGFPAMLLIHGSGPTDRDGNQPPAYITNLEKQVAAALALNGVASPRIIARR